ncbi:N-acetyltransferase family protein [Pantoea agglomerans]|jgi:phosphinothricin acetyltransferase|uniref:GNAT family N-acetyltransferase n=1 Tax=Pantoea TaxID=53335 RepID=UPI0006909B03|nr:MULTISPECIES: GNAT family N-acetyltransferase [Pantoea]KOA70511.1 acetyltransferase [Pantoea sp. CFSAN033090]MBD8262103.1 N-acetyltransferase [Pantoea agglomerans]MBT8497974.1 acetyltransferase [Pantoea agglomerans]MDQ0551158.1 L-amino acid N-acyltransferase YncA [Pantoea agglomerans]WLO86640.1 GNAT family N-acetyltransferase [Pantoea agglomerans]
MIIRAAVESDAEIIAEIYNDAVLNTTAIWNENRIDVANRIAWINSRQQAGFPVIVATDKDDTVLGYASYGDWRPWDGYRHTVEHSVYVHKDVRGKGAGAALMQGLIQLAREAGKHVMVAAIESENAASIALHKKLGFIESGRMTEVGTKFGRWLDLTFLQLRLDERKRP